MAVHFLNMWGPLTFSFSCYLFHLLYLDILIVYSDACFISGGSAHVKVCFSKEEKESIFRERRERECVVLELIRVDRVLRGENLYVQKSSEVGPHGFDSDRRLKSAVKISEMFSAVRSRSSIFAFYYLQAGTCRSRFLTFLN